MSVDIWSTLLDEALHSLRTMNPQGIEAAQRKLELAVQTHPLNREYTDRVKLVRAAAMHASMLWHIGLPQAGYSPAGALEQEAGGVCVTG